MSAGHQPSGPEQKPRVPRTGSGVKPAPPPGLAASFREVAIARLDLAPGDVLVATLDRAISTARTADALRDYLAEALPPGVKILVLGPEATLSVIRPEAT